MTNRVSRNRATTVTGREACADMCRYITDMLHWCDVNGCHDTGTVSVSINTLFKLFNCAEHVYSSMTHGNEVYVPDNRKSMYDYLCHGRPIITPDKAGNFADLYFGPTSKEKERKDIRKSDHDFGLKRNEWPGRKM